MLTCEPSRKTRVCQASSMVNPNVSQPRHLHLQKQIEQSPLSNQKPCIPKQSWPTTYPQTRTSSSPRPLKFRKFYSPVSEEASCALLAHQRLTHCSTRASKDLHYLYVLKKETRKKGQKCSDFVYAQPAVPLSPTAEAQIISSSHAIGLACNRVGSQNNPVPAMRQRHFSRACHQKCGGRIIV